MNHAWIKFLPSFIQERLEGRHTLQRIISNTGWLSFDQMLRMAGGLLVGVWIARYLGPANFGILSYAFAFVALFSAFATLGLDGIAICNIVRDPDSTDNILGTAFVLKMIAGVLTLALTIGAISMMRPDDTLTRWMVTIISAGIIFQAFNVIDFWFQSQVQSKYTVYAKNTAFLLANIAKAGLILTNSSLISFAWVGLFEVVAGAVGIVAIYRITGRHIKNFTATFQCAKNLLRNSWPIIFSGTFVLINLQIDKIMLGEISGNIEVGLYSAASRLCEVWYFVPVIVGASVAPALTMENDRDEFSYHHRLQQTYNLMTMFAIALALPITFLAKKIMYILYGADYSTASHVLSVNIWSAIFIFHVSIRSRALIIEGLQRFIAVYSFFTMASNIIFNLVLIPRYGGVGAAYASLLSWMVSVLLTPYLSRKTVKSANMFFKSFNLFPFIKSFLR